MAAIELVPRSLLDKALALAVTHAHDRLDVLELVAEIKREADSGVDGWHTFRHPDADKPLIASSIEPDVFYTAARVYGPDGTISKDRFPDMSDEELVARGDVVLRFDDSPGTPLTPSAAGAPLHDAEQDPTATGRRGGGSVLELVGQVAELVACAELASKAPADYLSRAPLFAALGRRTLDMMGIIEATNESLSQVLDFRAEVIGSLRELDERVVDEVPEAMTAIASTLGRLEVSK